MTPDAAHERYKQELRDKVAVLVRTRFGGDWKVAFGHYASDGAVTKPELEALLADAGVRNAWDRWAWASAIIAEQDADADGRVSWPEFATAFKVVEPTRSHSPSCERGRSLGTSPTTPDGEWTFPPRAVRPPTSVRTRGRCREGRPSSTRVPDASPLPSSRE